MFSKYSLFITQSKYLLKDNLAFRLINQGFHLVDDRGQIETRLLPLEKKNHLRFSPNWWSREGLCPQKNSFKVSTQQAIGVKLRLGFCLQKKFFKVSTYSTTRLRPRLGFCPQKKSCKVSTQSATRFRSRLGFCP